MHLLQPGHWCVHALHYQRQSAQEQNQAFDCPSLLLSAHSPLSSKLHRLSFSGDEMRGQEKSFPPLHSTPFSFVTVN